ncbi:DNA-processing protein DprA [Nitratidesulfovibrio sp. SRB-5]|uniref:DNA-processing protein DprA n=1 Tax=Nitratidesulfovibrio sp. SRB-5 TaxID=2872636 RepID=UPI001CBF338D|nr:DNA-processing protein DprA [Nitratidesulfovibrio sp. SRB-5]
MPAFVDLDEAGRAELWAALALRHSPGIGPRTVRRLLAGLGSALAAVQAADRGGHDWTLAGVRPHMAAPVARGVWRDTARQEWDAVRACRCSILLWTDPRYPARLREVFDAPAVLYCRGDASLLANHAVAVVGSRLSSRAGRGVAADIAYSLSAAGVTVVSGLARGIDREAHVAALEEVGSTIGVLGTGIDVVYPPEHAELFERMEATGLLVSEYAPGTLPLPAHFPVRNRIISGFSVGVLVVEAAARSGSLITARLALEQGREVYAVPGPATAQYTCGCRGLIEQGARPVATAEDMLADLAPVLGMELAALAAPCPPPGWGGWGGWGGRDDAPLDEVFSQDFSPNPVSPVSPGAPNAATDRNAATGALPDSIRPIPYDAASQPLKLSGGTAVVPDGQAMQPSTEPVAVHPPVPGPAGLAGGRGVSADPAPTSRASAHAAAAPPATLPASPGLSGAHPAPRQSRIRKSAPPAPCPSCGSGGTGTGGGPDDAILAFLHGRPGAHVDDICRALSMGAADVSCRLVLLEVKGGVRRLPGMRYERM